MLNFNLRRDDGILELKLEGPLEAADFRTPACLVDCLVAGYLHRHDMLRGIMLHAPAFFGWKDFGALVAHLKFVRLYHHRIEKVAIVADGGVATIMPRIANDFLHAQVEHFNLAHEEAAWNWLMARGRTRRSHDTSKAFPNQAPDNPRPNLQRSRSKAENHSNPW